LDANVCRVLQSAKTSLTSLRMSPRFSNIVLLLCLALPLQGQNLLTNGSFETGTSQPNGWTLYYGPGQWENFGHTGGRSVSVSNYNANCNGMQWRSSVFSVEPGRPLLINGWMHSSNAAEVARAAFGLVTPANVSLVDRFVYPPTDWRPFPFVAQLPRNQTNVVLRFASCEGAGTLALDDAEVLPVTPVHSKFGGSPLGMGEQISAGSYSYATSWRDIGQGFYPGNYGRCFYDHNAMLNTFYVWEMNAGTFMTFRHEFGGQTFTNATARISTGYNSGLLFMEFSADGSNWITAFTNSSPTGYNFITNSVVAPASLFPATNLFVRMRVAAGGYYRPYGYSFSAGLSGSSLQAKGETLLVAERAASPLAWPESISSGPAQSELTMGIQNTNAEPRDNVLKWWVHGPAGTNTWVFTNSLASLSSTNLILPFAGVGAGENTIYVLVTDALNGSTNYFGSAIFRENILRESSYGAMISTSPECAVWTCDATYKVGRDRVLPVATNAFAHFSAARNEYEPVQVVLRPNVALSNAIVSVTDLAPLSPSNSVSISATNFEICLVEYVPVTEPTDYTGVIGMHPDPLLPWTNAIHLSSGVHQPIWITVHVPKNAAAGLYEATLTIQSDATTIQIPLRLQVRDFALSSYTHTKWGIRTGVNEYWHGNPPANTYPTIYDIYLQNFARHRVSPINPDLYAPLVWNLVNTTNGVTFTYDFTAYDTALERYVDEFGFSSFNVPIVPNFLNGNPRFTPAYRQLYKQLMGPIMAHLRERGWLQQAYCWWYDEPDPYALTNLVVPGMQAVGEAAPGLRRQLTREPLTELDGLIETWVPLTHWLDLRKVPQRKAYGESFWWYMAGVPGAPYANWFTDHPANDARLRMWTNERYGIEGEMYWNTIWWIGTGHANISPWTNALTRIYDGLAVGNGGGVLFFPPTKTPPATPLITGPINTLRWELIREGMEDREYFWLLGELLNIKSASLGTNHPAVTQGVAAREQALSIILSRTYYESDPQKLYAARQLLAEAIEALDDGTPVLAREPVSRAVSLGGAVKLYSEAVGWPVPGCQWQHAGTNFPGATNAVLSLTNIGNNHLGEWRMIAANSNGSVTSKLVRLGGYWLDPPQIIAQSIGDNRRVGDRTVFDVTAVSALPLLYQWRFNGSPIIGATNPAIALTNLTLAQGGSYTVVVSNSAGVAVSDSILLNMPVGISSHPANLTVVAGGTANFSVTPAGTPPFNYQWLFNSTNVPGATNALLTLTNVQPVNAGGYRVTIANTQGALTSSIAILTVHVSPSFVLSPTNTEVVTGDTAILGASATGVPSPAYQWLFNETSAVNGATNANLILTNVPPTAAGNYRVTAANAAGSVTSSVVTLTVWVPPSILQQPTNLVVASGSDAGFSVQAAGMGTLSYQWYFESNAMVGATSDVLQLTAVQSNHVGAYRVAVSNQGGATFSAPGFLSLFGPAVIVEPPVDQSVIVTNNALFSVVAGGTPPLRYQWYYDETNLLAGATNESLLLTNVPTSAAGGYSVAVTNVFGGVTSSVVNLTVLVPPAIEAQPTNLTAVAGTNVEFLVLASGTAPLSYQWFFEVTNALGLDTNVLALTDVPVAAMGSYHVRVTNQAGTATSAPAMLWVMPNYQSEPPGLSINRVGSNIFLLLSPDNRARALLGSADLVDWTNLFVVPPSAMLWSTNDPAAAEFPWRFYQLRTE
jgi:hypothetical protein